MNEYNDEHSDIPDYRSLSKEEPPPSALQRNVLSALRNQRLIADSKQSRGWKLPAAVVACLLFFAAGAFFEKQHLASPGGEVSMSQKTFALFLLEDSSYKTPVGEAEEQKRVDLYRSWARNLRSKGVPVTGTKLQDSVNVVEKLQTQGHNGSGIAGYFLIDAKDLNEALSIARTCPHLLFGGKIELRQIQPV